MHARERSPFLDKKATKETGHIQTEKAIAASADANHAPLRNTEAFWLAAVTGWGNLLHSARPHLWSTAS